MAQQIPPPASGMSPQEYYSFLTSRGVPGWQAYDAVTGFYGSPQEAKAKYEEAGKPGQDYAWGQVAGYVGGALATNEILSGGENVRGWFKVKQPDGTVQDVEVPPVQTTETGQPVPVSTDTNPLIADKPTIVGTAKDGSAMMSDGTKISADGAILAQWSVV